MYGMLLCEQHNNVFYSKLIAQMQRRLDSCHVINFDQ